MYFCVAVDPYCIIEVEGAKVRTPHMSDNLNPTFNYGGVFYVKRPTEARIKIQVCMPLPSQSQDKENPRHLFHHTILQRVNPFLVNVFRAYKKGKLTRVFTITNALTHFSPTFLSLLLENVRKPLTFILPGIITNISG